MSNQPISPVLEPPRVAMPAGRRMLDPNLPADRGDLLLMLQEGAENIPLDPPLMCLQLHDSGTYLTRVIDCRGARGIVVAIQVRRPGGDLMHVQMGDFVVDLQEWNSTTREYVSLLTSPQLSGSYDHQHCLVVGEDLVSVPGKVLSLDERLPLEWTRLRVRHLDEHPSYYGAFANIYLTL